MTEMVPTRGTFKLLNPKATYASRHGTETPAVMTRSPDVALAFWTRPNQVKICDFGLARLKAATAAAVASHGPGHRAGAHGAGAHGGGGGKAVASAAAMTGQCGTVQWMAPEVKEPLECRAHRQVSSYVDDGQCVDSGDGGRCSNACRLCSEDCWFNSSRKMISSTKIQSYIVFNISVGVRRFII